MHWWLRSRPVDRPSVMTRRKCDLLLLVGCVKLLNAVLPITGGDVVEHFHFCVFGHSFSVRSVVKD